MKKLLYLAFFIFFLSCSQNEQVDEAGPALLPQPKTVPLNSNEGYALNPFSGDSIKPIIQSNGDTLKSGIAISVVEKIIHPDSVAKPVVTKSGSPTIIDAHPNRLKVHEELTVIPVDQSKLKKIPLEQKDESDTTNYILNSTGKKVETGVPIIIKGKIVEAPTPKPIVALVPKMKEHAIADMHYWEIEQGLHSAFVNDIMKDKRNNLWIATWGNGVIKYNGKYFVNLTTKEGLSGNSVYSILEDKKGNLWFSTFGGGICKYNGKKFVHYTENEGLSSNLVKAIVEDKNGNIWFGTKNGGVMKFDGESFVNYTKNEGLSGNYIFSIIEDKNGNLWFGSIDGGATMFDGKTFIQFTATDGLSSGGILCMAEATINSSNSGIWFGTNGGGVSFYNGKSFTNFTIKDGLVSNSIMSMIEDSGGNIWFGGIGGGVCKFDGEFFTQFNEKNGLSSNYIYSIFENENGSFWFGANGSGICEYNPKSFNRFAENDFFTGKNVFAIAEDKNGSIYFGTWGDGLFIYNGDKFEKFTENEGLPSNKISALQVTQNGDIWIGTWGDGAAIYDGEKFTHYTTAEGLSHNLIHSIFEDKKGNIWFGTGGGGVSKFDGVKFSHLTVDEGLVSNTTYSVFEDKIGNLWFANLYGGVSSYNGESIIHYTEKEGLSNNSVNAIHQDNDSAFWFATNGGLSRFDGLSFTHYSEAEGLSSNGVVAILEDKNENIFLSTARGLSFLEKKEKLNTTTNEKKYTAPEYKIQHFNSRNGIKATDFILNSALIDSKNRAWWGGTKSLEMLDLNEFELSDVIPEPSIVQVDINEQYFDYHNFNDSLGEIIQFDRVADFENAPINLTLPYDKNHLTFYYVAIDWAAPTAIKYQYKLEGLDPSWSTVTEQSFADYRNISYGDYTFKVRSIGESRTWSEPVSFSFTILPPWWHTWWARCMYLVLILIVLFLVYRWRISALQKRQKELEKTVEERTAEVIKEKEIVEHQKEIIEEKHKEITDSINYAERIQRSFLATKELLDQNLNEYFVYFQPKDVVSGDFYWASKLNNDKFALCCADSTGHGVPGAIMSILNISSLEKAIETQHEPSEILNHTRVNIINRLKKDGSKEGGKDGMDCSLLVFDFDKSVVDFSAANNPIWVIRNHELTEYKGDKMPVGKHDKDQTPFSQHQIQLQKGDIIYTLTDGMPDQFGGEKGKKFKHNQLKDLLISIAEFPLKEQKEKINAAFSNWKKDLEQVDDVCVVGVRMRKH